MASEEQVGMEGKCPACGRITKVPETGTLEKNGPLEEGLPTEEMANEGEVEESSTGINSLRDLEDEAEDQPRTRSWVRSPRFAMLASIIVVVVVALVVFMVVRSEKQAGEEVAVIKEIQPLVESEEEASPPAVGALLEEVGEEPLQSIEEEPLQPMEEEPAPGSVVEEAPIEAVSTEQPAGEEAETTPADEEKEVVASIPEETQPAKETPPTGAYTINVASFRNKDYADQYVEELKKQGVDAFDWQIELPDKGTWYRVSVGGFATREEAENYASELKEKGISQTFITKIPGAS